MSGLVQCRCEVGWTEVTCCLFSAVEQQQVPVPELEVVTREMPPALESEAPAEEIYDHSEAPVSEGEEDDGVVVENPAAAVAEVPESSPSAPVAVNNVNNEPESSGEAPKKHSYASIVSFFTWDFVAYFVQNLLFTFVVWFLTA